MPSDRQHLVDAYWKNYALTHGSREERVQADEWFWAWIEVEDSVRAASPDVFDLVLALVASAPNDDALNYVGAGPLEDLINWHGAAFVDRIEESARKNRAFRYALFGVRLSEEVPSAVRERLALFIAPFPGSAPFPG
jgi:hypothetical protein